jgi:FKBP-type peptidyl-prolyl cis-trans isomerase 2
MKKEIFGIVFLAALLALSGCTQPAGENGENEGPAIIQPSGGNGGSAMNVEKVESGDKVAVEYRGTLEDGAQFDASEGRGPLEFTAGAGQMIKGFDNAVIGMALNEEKTITMQASEAYGETDPGRIQEIPKSQINDADSLQIGMSVTSQGTGVNGIVTEIRDDVIVIDFNHRLAGKPLTFWIKVVKIEKS